MKITHHIGPQARQVSVIEVMYTDGAGTEEDPARIVTIYRGLDGEFLARRDRWAESQVEG